MTLMGILAEIEELRQNMHRIANVKGTTADQEVLAASQKLDIAINKYYRIVHTHFRTNGCFD